jgi:hypothetical protein
LQAFALGTVRFFAVVPVAEKQGKAVNHAPEDAPSSALPEPPTAGTDGLIRPASGNGIAKLI